MSISVWTFQLIGKEDKHPDILNSVILPSNSSIEEATNVMAEEIWQELANFGYEIPENPPSAKNILKYLNEINDRSRSFYVVKVFPAGASNMQKKY